MTGQISDLILAELKTLTSTTRFGHAVEQAHLEISAEKAEISVPWEGGVWKFSGGQTPIPGTMLVVEVDEETPSTAPRVIGKVDRFYLAKR
jgi:hypothetical protein